MSSCGRLDSWCGREPRGDLSRAVVEEAAIGMDPVRAGVERAPTEGEVIVLTDGQDRSAADVRDGDRGDAVVCACGEVDDHSVDVGQRHLQTGQRPNGDRVGAGPTDEIGQAAGPDQVVGEDRDPGRQSSVSAR
jgi:hypothetical protein